MQCGRGVGCGRTAAADRDSADRDSADRDGADRDGADRADAGAAVVDFAFISLLLLFLLFGVIQIAVFFYARNIAAGSAAQAARYAAAEGVDPVAGAARAQELIRQGLDDADAAAIRCTSGPRTDARSGLPVTTVHCVGRVRLFFTPLAIPLTIDVTSSVLREQVPR